MRTRLIVVLAGVVAITTMALPSATRAEPLSASAGPSWAPASRASIHPGVVTRTGPMRCIVNFVFYDSNHVYVGQAAHCSGASARGCRFTTTYGVGTRVRIQGASRPGKIVYNSWDTMVGADELSWDACYGNDFALVQLDDADVGRVNPSVPIWGGPTGAGGRSSLGAHVYSYTNSETSGTSPRVGIDVGNEVGNALGWERSTWTHGIQWVPPWGWNTAKHDVLGGVLDARGRALGVPSTWSYDLSNSITDLSKAMAYMKANTSLDAVQLAKGTTRFLPPR